MVERFYEVWEKEGKEEETWMVFRRFAISYRKSFFALIEKEKVESWEGFNYDDEDILPALHVFCHYLKLSLKSLIEKAGFFAYLKI